MFYISGLVGVGGDGERVSKRDVLFGDWVTG